MIGRRRPDVPVLAGEKVLAWATGVGGDVVAGTRDAVYVAGVRVPWEQVEAADWDVDTSVLRISEVGRWGDVRPEHVLTLEEPGRLLELVRERVTATVLLQRHVPIRGRRGVRVPWEQVEAADWDRENEVLRVVEVGTWGEVRPEHRFEVTEPGRLLELVRERVTASLVLHRHVPISGKRGVRVIARRSPRGNQPVRWFFAYDAGVDPTDPFVDTAAQAALAAAREELGED